MVAYKWIKYASTKGNLLVNLVKSNPLPLFAAGVLVGTGLKDVYDGCQFGMLSAIFGTVSAKSEYTNILEKYGAPNNLTTLRYSNHHLQYDHQKRIPLWVSEHITKDSLNGNADRQQCNFKPDDNIPEKFRSRNDDYLNSGYTRGHMMPAADNKSDQDAMSETFYLSNIVPQDMANNAGFWYRMETYCRKLLKKYSDLYIISGPLFLPTTIPGTEDKVVSYKLIGKNDVAVPTHLYKVVLAENLGKPVSIAAFVVPNKEIDENVTLKDTQVTLDELEKLSGIDFFPKLRLKWVKNLCEVESCKMISKKAAEIFPFTIAIKKAKSMEELDKVFIDINNKKIQVNKEFMDLYWEKKNKLKNS